MRILGQKEFDKLYSLEMLKVTQMNLTAHDTANNRYLHLSTSDSLFIEFKYTEMDDFVIADISFIVGKCDTYNGIIYINVVEVSTLGY